MAERGAIIPTPATIAESFEHAIEMNTEVANDVDVSTHRR